MSGGVQRKEYGGGVHRKECRGGVHREYRGGSTGRGTCIRYDRKSAGEGAQAEGHVSGMTEGVQGSSMGEEYMAGVEGRSTQKGFLVRRKECG